MSRIDVERTHVPEEFTELEPVVRRAQVGGHADERGLEAPRLMLVEGDGRAQGVRDAEQDSLR